RLEERDLAERLTRTTYARPPSRHFDLHLAVSDDVERVARIAGVEDDVTGVEPHRREPSCELLFRRLIERREERHVREERGREGGERCVCVDDDAILLLPHVTV